ncbi:replication restart DNA helicase PriA [Halospina denitrificans]|uniref:Replication restart protein PriA n=1 Tax=Halospina denitrificans TaxID=332522 RepID=A0A4R7JJD1_9GAMM|nr:primosomal protein N' [Halospina denitrificans]TDT37033.1 replication restart DNA helicase PriA [Halospina denitrificans]
MAQTVRVALPRPVRQLFDYRVPEGMDLVPGQRIRVPLGRQRLTALVVELDPPELPNVTLKDVESPLEDWPVLPDQTRELLLWASRYYQHPPGECVFAALPPALRRGAPAELPAPEYWYPATAHTDDLSAQARRQRELLQWLIRYPGQTISTIRSAGFNRSLLKALHERDLVRMATGEDINETAAPWPPAPGVSLNDAQHEVLSSIEQNTDAFQPHLLFGITGSGKTEVYIRHLQQRLVDDPEPESAQALVLVPEISLTPQTLARFEQHFGSRMAVWHSALNATERLQTWSRVRRGEPLILIGTRSAVLLPFSRLITVVVDEEHDSSYKQMEGFRYSARDLAIYRARQSGCPVILGSATPSLESLHNAGEGRFRLHRLTERAGSAGLPETRLIDVRSRPLEGGLSRPLIDQIETTIKAEEQVLLFINRRGFSPVVMCFECGTPIECPHCDARLTYHRFDNCLRCHHCGHQQALPRKCPECGEEALNAVGQGTEKTETVLQQRFPDTPVLRIDRDSTRRRGQLDEMLKPVREGQPCILVGTQMLAKGHDFPAVTLAGILDADGGLFSSDFRGPEHLAQLVMQVGGRSGRAAKTGRVLIQTCQSGHPMLNELCQGDYLSVAWKLLDERKAADLPPATFMTAFRVEGPSMEDSLTVLDELADKVAATAPDIPVLGPFPAIIARKAGRYRAQILLQHQQRPPLHRLTNQLCQYLEQKRLPASLRWSVDVDPQSLD